eukprot:TRINITY_DN812_c0_g1_i4.p1 TRINITY_DN812_c0_g1~~TRINITY_DN812_c0_g1_i4.p1  ORF type:complete len:703 (-),score=229.49 TRINITY_DN812_c0_g1_i4:50-2158(-)
MGGPNRDVVDGAGDGVGTDAPNPGAGLGNLGNDGNNNNEDESQIDQSVDAQVKSMESCDMFFAEISTPVNVPKDESALVPLFDEKVTGKRYSHFQPSWGNHPLSSIFIENSTKFLWERGPAVVTQSGNFLGEAQLEILRQGKKALLPFAVDFGIVVKQVSESTEYRMSRVVIKNRSLKFHVEIKLKTQYVIRNDSQREVEVLLDHKLRQDFKLNSQSGTFNKISPPSNFARFLVRSSAQSKKTFQVETFSTSIETFQLEDVNHFNLKLLVEKSWMDPKVAAELQVAMTLSEDLREISKKIPEIMGNLDEVLENQHRIRGNFASLPANIATSDFINQLGNLFISDETKISKFLQDLKTAKKHRDEKKEEIHRKLVGISMDLPVNSDFSDSDPSKVMQPHGITIFNSNGTVTSPDSIAFNMARQGQGLASYLSSRGLPAMGYPRSKEASSFSFGGAVQSKKTSNAPSAFGAASSTSSQSSGGLGRPAPGFGASALSSGGVFGRPAPGFGASVPTPSPAPSTTSLFGPPISQSGFGTVATTSSPFGAPASSSLFGASTTPSAFGSNPSPSPFAASTSSLFGASTTPSAFGSNPSPFGASTTSSTPSLFGAQTPSAFGATSFGTHPSGFKPTLVDGSELFMSTTAMPAHATTSFEELRAQAYTSTGTVGTSVGHPTPNVPSNQSSDDVEDEDCFAEPNPRFGPKKR